MKYDAWYPSYSSLTLMKWGIKAEGEVARRRHSVASGCASAVYP